MKSLKIYINYLLAHGRYFFSESEAMADLELGSTQFKSQVRRLQEKGAIKRIKRDFYMVIPAEHSQIGSLPAHWVVGPLMEYLQQDYYIGLLTAASIYGATEQQPMVFQVITDKSTRAISLGRVRIEFHAYKYCANAVKSSTPTPTGYARTSVVSQTMVDLIRFYQVCGYLSNVAGIIKNLAAEFDSDQIFFEEVVKREKTKTVLQRLGYILEITNFPILANVVDTKLAEMKLEYVLLQPESSLQDGLKNQRWKLIINEPLDFS